MDTDRSAQLLAKYPALFGAAPGEQPSFYFEHGDGWFGLVDALCAVVAAHCQRCPPPQPFFWAQIKEKFGGLRCYAYNADEYVQGAIAAIEAASLTVCERCGQPGRRRGTGWLYTVCDACEEFRQHGRSAQSG